MDMKKLQKECATIALRRGKITQNDLILPDMTKFIDAAINELYEARQCINKNQFKTEIINGKPEGLAIEFIDTIRVLLTGLECLGADFVTEMEIKNEYELIRND